MKYLSKVIYTFLVVYVLLVFFAEWFFFSIYRVIFAEWFFFSIYRVIPKVPKFIWTQFFNPSRDKLEFLIPKYNFLEREYDWTY